MTKTQSNTLRVTEGRTLLTVDHNGQDLTFVYPSFGPGNYSDVGKQIQQAGLEKPTMAHTSSLVHAAFNSDDKYSKEIKDILRDKWLWAYTGILYVPNKGAYVQNDQQVENNNILMDESELVKKLEANDQKVRFVPFGFKIGEMTPIQLGKNSYVIALAGEEGAQKLSEVADKFNKKPFLYSFDSVDKPITRVSALDSCRYFDVGLFVDGNILGDDRYGCAFGVLDKTGEASRQKK